MSSQITIRRETEQDKAKIGEINHLAFGKYKEPAIVERLRKDGDIVLSLVAEREGQLVGHIMLSRGFVEKQGGERVKVVMIGPVAVLPEFQKQGIGSQLMQEGIEQARKLGESAIILLGHKEYYPRFGFNTLVMSGIESTFNKENFMGLELTPGSLSNLKGKVKYAKAFGLAPEWTA